MPSIKNTYDSRLIASYMLSLADEKGMRLNTTQTQKLLYISYGMALAKYDNSRIIDESPQAWPFGPVFPKTRKIDYVKIRNVNDPYYSELKEEEELKLLLSLVIDKFGSIPANKLSDWSHEPNSPWEKTTKIEGFKWGMQISDNDIKQYFANF